MGKEITGDNFSAENVDKEKIKSIYKKGLVSLEILKVDPDIKNVAEAEALYENMVKHKTYLITDTDEPYVIRLSYTEDKNHLKNVDPEYLEDMAKFEISESIQEILKEEGFPVIDSNFPQKDAEVEDGE